MLCQVPLDLHEDPMCMALDLILQKRKVRHRKRKELGTQVGSGDAGNSVRAALPPPRASLPWKAQGSDKDTGSSAEALCKTHLHP